MTVLILKSDVCHYHRLKTRYLTSDHVFGEILPLHYWYLLRYYARRMANAAAPPRACLDENFLPFHLASWNRFE